MWATRWGVPVTESGSDDFAAFMDGVLTAGTSPNGVFSARIMWGSMGDLVGNLTSSGVALPGPDDQVLRQAFGPTHFIWLRRLDTLAQAVSWARAEQTRIWHRLDGQTVPDAAADPVYDFEQIHTLVETIHAHNAAWSAWFAENGIAPLPLSYEALDADPPAEIRRILGYLGLDTEKAAGIRARNIRLADELSLEWMARYRREFSQRQDGA